MVLIFLGGRKCKERSQVRELSWQSTGDYGLIFSDFRSSHTKRENGSHKELFTKVLEGRDSEGNHGMGLEELKRCRGSIPGHQTACTLGGNLQAHTSADQQEGWRCHPAWATTVP